jgi:hypothetical protein
LPVDSLFLYEHFLQAKISIACDADLTFLGISLVPHWGQKSIQTRFLDSIFRNSFFVIDH